MKSIKSFTIDPTIDPGNIVKFERGGVIGREHSRGCGKNPRVTYYREWTCYVYSPKHRAWIHDGKQLVGVRATRKQVMESFDR